VEAVEKWRERAKNVCEGRDVPKEAAPTVPGGGGKPGERYIKI
ncbi:MAG: CesT family type III secretion system chaperone, partial [Verrucomicrobia bacterium]|nr:CesT family type III secretion system chaperone [Verrucomicrobiota bacterium]